MSKYTIRNEEMQRRLRVAELQANLTNVIGVYASDKMTALDVLEALAFQTQRFLKMAIEDSKP